MKLYEILSLSCHKAEGKSFILAEYEFSAACRVAKIQSEGVVGHHVAVSGHRDAAQRAKQLAVVPFPLPIVVKSGRTIPQAANRRVSSNKDFHHLQDRGTKVIPWISKMLRNRQISHGPACH